MVEANKGDVSRALRTTMVIALFLRIAVLLFILSIGRSFSDPYYISDDRTYELLATRYLGIARTPFDLSAFKAIGAYGYLEVFWPWIMCVSAKLVGSVYAGRIINCLLSVINIKLVYDLTIQVCKSELVALRAARLMAFLPVMVLVCCFPIKDIFLMYAVLNTFLLLVRWQGDDVIPLRSLIWEGLLLYAVNHTRGAILEFFAIIFMLFLIAKIRETGNNKLLFISIVAIVVMMAFLWNPIMMAFQVKVDAYGGVVENGNMIKMIQMRNPWEIYKIPFSYFYATLQPFLLNLFDFEKLSIWAYIINLLNISIYPVAIGNYLYIFQRKHDALLWVSSTILMAAISALSLGNSRHYFFMMPYTILNFCLATEKPSNTCRFAIYLGPFILFFLVILMTAR